MNKAEYLTLLLRT